MNKLAKLWPADKVQRRPVAELVPYARNARLHSDAQVAQIAASIGEWGWTMPVLLDEAGGIIAGHGRVLAAKKLGIDAIPCMVAKGWSEAQKKAYVIADNKIADNAIWDEELLRIEFEGLDALNFDLGLIGFSAEEIAAIRQGMGGGQSGAGSLSERFMIPPFSVLNAREGWWQDRKSAWIALGIQSELGRGENALGFSDTILEPDPAKRAAANKKASFADQDKLNALQRGAPHKQARIQNFATPYDRIGDADDT